MIYLHHTDNGVQNKKPNDISLQSHPAFIKTKPLKYEEKN
jgi:hypothetical protein